MTIYDVNTYDEMVEYLQKEKGIYSQSVFIKFCAKAFKPKQLPKKHIQINYINNNISEFKKWVSNYFSINYEEKKCLKRPLTEYASRRALARCILSWDDKRKEKRRYYCEQCEAWHLTSKPNKNL